MPQAVDVPPFIRNFLIGGTVAAIVKTVVHPIERLKLLRSVSYPVPYVTLLICYLLRFFMEHLDNLALLVDATYVL